MGVGKKRDTESERATKQSSGRATSHIFITHLYAFTKEEYRGLRRSSKQSSTGNLLERAPPIKLTSDPMDYIIYTSIGKQILPL